MLVDRVTLISVRWLSSHTPQSTSTQRTTYNSPTQTTTSTGSVYTSHHSSPVEERSWVICFRLLATQSVAEGQMSESQEVRRS